MPKAPVPLSVQAVADLVGGRLLGGAGRMLTAVGPLEGADGETLSILSSTRYLPEFRGSAAGAVLLKPGAEAEPAGPTVRIVVSDPQAAMARVLAAMFPTGAEDGSVHPTARLGAGVMLGDRVVIGP
ncbi:MAG: hypothetical protein HOP28_08315, partial [Gemmatimonadales bacterium]|nr:hypothetical protein [Gemmatimonadales bacterium]